MRRVALAREVRVRPRAKHALWPAAHASAGTSAAEDLEELRIAFANERFAPELLPHRDDLVRRVRQAVDEQVRCAMRIASGLIARSCGRERRGSRASSAVRTACWVMTIRVPRAPNCLERSKTASASLGLAMH